MIIARYISKEIFMTFSAITLILLFVTLSNRFVVFLTKAASGELPINLVLKVVGLYIPEFFGFLAPVAVYIAILFAHSRIHADSEASVLLTCGFDWSNLTWMTMKFAMIVALIVGGITLFVVPEITEYREQILADGEAVGVIHSIVPGQFQTVDDGKLVFYVEDVQEDGTLSKIFIAQQPRPDKIAKDQSSVVITAEWADVKELTNDGNEFYLVLYNGRRYTGVPGSADYTVTTFSEYGRELKYESGPVPSFHRLRPTLEILDSTIPGDIAELQWRCAMPIAVLILSLLAISMAKVNPRQGRYTKFLPAILLYIAYYNLMTIIKRWVADGSVPGIYGLWWVHVLFLILAFILLAKVSGRWYELYYQCTNRMRNKT